MNTFHVHFLRVKNFAKQCSLNLFVFFYDRVLFKQFLVLRVGGVLFRLPQAETAANFIRFYFLRQRRTIDNLGHTINKYGIVRAIFLKYPYSRWAQCHDCHKCSKTQTNNSFGKWKFFMCMSSKFSAKKRKAIDTRAQTEINHYLTYGSLGRLQNDVWAMNSKTVSMLKCRYKTLFRSSPCLSLCVSSISPVAC